MAAPLPTDLIPANARLINLQPADLLPDNARIQHGTAISWTHWPNTNGVTLVTVTGCTPCSPACGKPLGPGYCYAAVLSASTGPRGLAKHPKYQGVAENNQFTGVVKIHPAEYDKVDHWTRTRRTIFETSMGDWLHPRVTREFIALGFAVVAGTPRHNWLKLSKRHSRMVELLTDPRFRDEVLHAYRRRYGANAPLFEWPLPNLALGLTIENQEYAEKRMPCLAEVEPYCACAFVSAEPLLEETILAPWMHLFPEGKLWVIAGGQSGKDYQPLQLHHARKLRDECVEHGVAYYFKQVGGSRPTSGGRLLDGRTHDEFPAMAYREVPDARP